MTEKVNTWVKFTYVEPEKKKAPSTVCSVPGCGKPRQRMNSKYFRKMCKEHHARWYKAYLANRKLLSK